jgi:hypothetical protein
MKKILFTLFIFFFVNISNSQNFISKRLAYNLSRPSYKNFNTSYSPLKLKLAIKLDSTLARSYYHLANYYQNKENYLTNKGSIYYYCKFIDVNKRFPSDLFSNEYEIKELVKERLIAITSGYKKNPEFFKKDNKLSDFTQSELMKIVNDCVSDVEKYGLVNGIEGLYQTTFEIYFLKAQLDYDKNNLDSYFNTCQVILDKTKDEEFRLQVYDDIYNKLFKSGDTLSASIALNDNLKEYKLERKNNLEYRNKEKQLISLLNDLNKISDDKYDKCSSDGIEVFCRNKNIRIANYSSALKFWNTYFQEYSIFFDKLIESDGTLKNVYHYNMQRYFGFKYEHIPILYNFYLTKGKELGMIWPMFGGQKLTSEYFWSEKLRKLIELELKNSLSNVYDITFAETTSTYQQRFIIFSSSKHFNTDKDGASDSVVITDVFLDFPETYKYLLNIPVKYLDGNKKQFFTNRIGHTLPTSISCRKFYEIEKQSYENEQALIRAKQLQQEAEVRRLQEEQNYRETQLRLIEEENERKQKEIDLVNAKNKQLENKRALENIKTNEAFWEKVLNSSRSTGKSEYRKRTCEWCTTIFSNSTGFSFYKYSNGQCHITPSGFYCSKKCATEACNNK